MEIREVNNYSEFVGLKERWSELLQHCDQTVFSTWEWLTTWWRHFGKGKHLVILLAEENNKLIGIAPLMYSVHSMFGLRRGTIEFIGTGHPTYSNFIIREKHDECLQKFFDYLHKFPQKWNSAELINITGDYKSVLSLGRQGNPVSNEIRCLFVRLPSSHDEFLNNIKRKDRKEFRRCLRKLKQNGFNVDLVNYSEGPKILEGMDALFSVHQKNWISKGYTGKFSVPSFRNFCLDIAKCFSEKDWLGLYCLELSGKPVASLFGFKYKSKYYAYITGMDPAYKKFGVGNLVFLNTMKKCILDGLVEFDFMWGTDQYKKQWNPDLAWTFKTSVPKKGFFSQFEYRMLKEYWSHGLRLRYFAGKLLKGQMNIAGK